MIIKYKNYINEMLGTPDVIKRYISTVYDFCNDELTKYLKRKGSFANYTNEINIPWEELEGLITDEEFQKYPVEVIDIKFQIKLDKSQGTKIGHISSFHYYKKRRNKHSQEEDSYWMKSSSGIVNKSIRLLLDIGIIIGRDVRSIDLESLRESLRTGISHELHHSYEMIYNPNMSKNPLQYMWVFMNKLDIGDNLKYFFWRIYKISPPEMNADISTVYDIKDIDDFYNRSELTSILPIIEDFDVDKEIKEIERFYKQKGDDFKESYDVFGDIFVQIYLRACQANKYQPSRDILKLKNKNMKEVFEYWKKRFDKSSEYIKRKLYKKLAYDIVK